jgi:hypothetical protein
MANTVSLSKPILEVFGKHARLDFVYVFIYEAVILSKRTSLLSANLEL